MNSVKHWLMRPTTLFVALKWTHLDLKYRSVQLYIYVEAPRHVMAILTLCKCCVIIKGSLYTVS